MKAINCLLLDDDREDQQFFLEALHEITDVADCQCAENGKQALALIKKGFTPDIIFTDYNMPEMNGYEFVRVIKNDLRLQRIPIYVFTSLQTDHVASLFLSSGADAVFSKSTLDKLRKVLHQCINTLNRKVIL